MLPSGQHIAEKYDIEQTIVEQALHNIHNRHVLFLTVSGKIGAGKDSVAPLVVNRLGYSDAHHISFARPLREEVNEVIDCVRKAESLDEACNLVLNQLRPVNYEVVVKALYEDVKAGIVQTAYDRTPSTRKALQWWGTEVRRSVDEDYWVRKAMQYSIPFLAEGASIFVTDSRFPNEADAIKSVSGVILRLLVSPAVQAERIQKRDGKEPNFEALNHVSETAMDTYAFELAVDTDDKDLEAVVDEAITKVQEKINNYSV